jgi:L-iditol 2-dehydrogenase
MANTKTNRSAVSVGPKTFEIQDRPLSEQPLEPEEILVEVVATGICGSDFHAWEVGLAKPLTLGHESVGVVVEVGSAVSDRKVGDRVAIEPRQSCYT